MKQAFVTTFFQFLLICVVAGSGKAQSPSATSAPTDTAQHLSKEQLALMKNIQTESEKKAALVALKLAQVAKQIYQNMLADQENQALRQELTKKLNAATTELLAIKGQSIRDIVKVLTPEQKQRVMKEMQKPGASADLTELIGKVFNVTKP